MSAERIDVAILGAGPVGCALALALAREGRAAALIERRAANVPEAFWDIGVRIEDDVVVTATGCEVLTGEAPKRIDDIEALMRDGRTAA